ncbi:FemAB family XrtA/PEP-CTERM system-associated protein [Alteromonas macleodii]|jgi:FemAB-related protein (PEP-CTERM system-associated)|uniref:FemAB family XrtA/PEP-CTERM system-associated protein n=1 Tax=Alteromonas TaxID=226 RepID=UPI000C56244C|nr:MULTISPECIES: FemAB family XrtA/PEP-CTERM system-associated protein [Alteromonas]MBE91037.1 peptidoglycan bridge formation protein FemAB [Rhodospirillaceae bacterium]MCZ4240960.1 FemAB family PEP-CTERM system-associated protein [Alteromonas macleodii]PXW71556.1 FemAB-related protein (PEP-CTERM system-associated) [Alteromonas sp. I10]|tara:strand:+ start:7499 stop:8542 length:1044 start_codon:yes stop_codon:yes gene_type:complete
MSERVCKLATEKHDFELWDTYVDNHSEGSFFHLSGWRDVICEVYKHTPYYLILESNKTICGVLPLFEQKSRLFGHVLISTPFCVYGGAIADDDGGLLQLENAAAELGKKLNVDYVEFRYTKPRSNNSNLILNCNHSTYLMPIPDDEQAILQSIKKKQRANVRQSLKNELTAKETSDISEVHRIYSESVRNLGTPVFPKRYFSKLKEVFSDRVELLSIKNGEQPVSAVLSFYYKNKVLPYYGGGTPEARYCRGNDFMYYSLMCRAREKRDCEVFDFGRSKNNSGSGSYKKTWGIEPQPLYYYCQLVRATNLPNLSPDNPKYRYFIKMWKKLPLFVTERLGPYLSRFLG